jgi:CheY-like chemotaxis protein
MQILLVEEDREIRTQIGDWLADARHQVHPAVGIRRALQMLNGRTQFDLILTDLEFSDGSSHVLFSFLRSHQRLRLIPVIVITSAGDPQSVLQAKESGAVAFLIKPLDEKTLMAKITEAHGQRTGSVLIAEDDVVVQKLLARIVQNEGYTVCTASNGKDALSKMETEKVSLVISDIMMPEMDGMELLETLKTSHPKLPVLMITGRNSQALRQKAIENGADGYITKPFKNIEIAKTISAMLSK